MIERTAGEIADIVGGELHDADPATPVSGPVEFDSRRITPGSVFLALPGARVDGHDFAAGAAADGAALILAARPVGVPAVVVKPLGAQNSNAEAFAHDPDGSGAAVLGAVGALARRDVDELAADGLVVVGVTGSAGKTSVKDMMATILRTDGETVAPKGSFNNEIGHPYTVLRCTRDTRYLVAEMSARGIGHVAHLARIAPPRIGAVLNVGTAHLGEFGSREAIAQAKGELVEALPAAADGGVAVLNADDPLVAGMAPRTRAKVVSFGVDSDDADYRATDVTVDDLARASFTLHCPDGSAHPVALRVHGAHQVPNALAAAAVCIEAGLAPAAVAEALSAHVAASERRMEMRQRDDGVTVINDSYNANPDSMRAGVDALVLAAGARDGATSWAVLGQMGELGDTAVDEHSALAGYLSDRGVDRLVAVGEGANARALADAAEAMGLNTVRASDTDAAAEAVAKELRPGDVVLIKASYADGLWRVADALAPVTQQNSTERRGK
ncbi:UDP-N-acetylmuramoyl-tripeptide--D-alanyl-D-alanine ligase [Corynebacterium freneyi]|uniref:UDP-N-acetylmuramoyl-tripeptide--D-alanyl-D-alanine ligase n=1 Tax=Corynebacterium freneyi TaxID=134034 RepID=A0ABS4U7U6_9CORY|nr:UDP-N-acetylmuramoyl-tripeptide--D-alanyl-D-alanine ligase [Corynebacterium freneyi]MBP2332246.1 UDP-N-acetylmuramoyl-tripeptide--D-alanyl-D-alanine ligase [Corynebacterium freneyi]QXA53541.1 UDP-N-acetylmuramoyl-tripeptide--D-alanyl-D-alanine ligase [Corynebacterium freneyi]WJZ05644.1 UDP-N-acetylmuramoyl-tripeptide--D-alanyl-D-alanine ligase [Corynebacterium freneyi]